MTCKPEISLFKLRSKGSIVPGVFFTLVLLFAPGPVVSKGIVPTGESANIGLSASEITSTLSRPVPPLMSFLMDETFQTLIPVGSGTSLATWDKVEPNRIQLTLSANIVWGDAPTRILTPVDVKNSWAERALERWDARWALRGVIGIEDLSDGIEGLHPVNERTLEIELRSGINSVEMQRALASPALRLALGFSNTTMPDGTGPFLPEYPTPDRSRFTCALTHHAGRAYLNEVNIISYPSAEESVLDFGRGSLDGLIITTNERNNFAGSARADTERMETIGRGLVVLLFNPLRVPNQDERRAYAMAIDREGIADVVLGEGAVVAGDFEGSVGDTVDRTSTLNEARRLFSSIQEPKSELSLMVCDDPAAHATAGRLRANWESLGVPVVITGESGPLRLSMNFDAILLSFRIPEIGEGVLPQVLSLVDRNGWWDILALAIGQDNSDLLNSIRSLDPDAEIGELGPVMETVGLAIPIATFDILFAPGPDIALVPASVYPGSVLWRAYKETNPTPVELPSDNG